MADAKEVDVDEEWNTDAAPWHDALKSGVDAMRKWWKDTHGDATGAATDATKVALWSIAADAVLSEQPDVLKWVASEHKIDLSTVSPASTPFSGETLLFKACANGLLKAAQCLVVDCKVDTNVRDQSDSGTAALHAAVSAPLNPLELTKLLVEEGKADVNLASIGNGSTPLHEAALGGSVPVLTYLVSKGAKVDAFDGGNSTPLMCAALSGQVDAAKYLVEQAHAKIDLTNSQNRTALARAAEMGKISTVKYLLSAGANKALVPRNAAGAIDFQLASPDAQAAITQLLA